MSHATQFHIVYDGPALSSNEMDVKDLAPALLSLSEALDEANSIINKGRANIALSVKATFKTGCFGIDLSIGQDVIKTILDFCKNENVQSSAMLLGLLGFSVSNSTKGLIQLIKWMKGRNIQKIELIDHGVAKIIIDDDAFETEQRVINLLQNHRIRESLYKAIAKPLEKEGIDSFVSTDDINSPDKSVTVSKNEAKYFVPPEIKDELIEDQVCETHLQAVSVVFQEDNKWRFSDGQNRFYAEVLDDGFIKQVQNSDIAFRKNDLMKVTLRTKLWLTPAGMKKEYIVEKILSHRSAAIQIEIPFIKESD